MPVSTHVRAQIRAAVVTKLKEITAFENRVYPYRVKPFLTFPSMTVTTPEDKVDPERSVFGSTGPIDYHMVRLEVSIYRKAEDGLDNDLDAYCVSVEQKMAVDDTFGGLLKTLEPEGTEIGMTGDLEKPAGVAVMTWIGGYMAVRGTPTTAV